MEPGSQRKYAGVGAHFSRLSPMDHKRAALRDRLSSPGGCSRKTTINAPAHVVERRNSHMGYLRARGMKDGSFCFGSIRNSIQEKRSIRSLKENVPRRSIMLSFGSDCKSQNLVRQFSLPLSEVTGILERGDVAGPFFTRMSHLSWQNK